MANFEALIKNAIASQDVSSPKVREAVYQSSRNALQRIIDSNRALTVEDAMTQRAELEEAIVRIEAELAPAAKSDESKPNADKLFVSEDDPLFEIQQILTGGRRLDENKAQPKTDAQPAEMPKPTPNSGDMPSIAASAPKPGIQSTPATAPGAETVDPFVSGSPSEGEVSQYINSEDSYTPLPEEYPDHGTIPAGFTQRRKKQRIGGWVILIVGIFALLGWLGYEIYKGIEDGSFLGFDNSNKSSVSNELNAPDYITILTPNDLSALVVDGRGQAELVTRLNQQMIRLMSTRDKAFRNQPAEPLLIRLKPGVLEQISGKNVTVEIYAKSDTDEQSQFSVACDFANGSNCGRKRFVAGLQPQASVFEFPFGVVPDPSDDYFITLSTDTTGNAAISGDGDVLDIVYVRLKATGN